MNNYDFVRPATRALWKLEDDGEDSGPYEYDLVEGQLDYTLGRFGRCGYFDGNNYLRSTSTLSQLQLSTMSACFWMRSNYTSEQYIFGNVYTGYGNTYGYCFGITSSHRLFYESFPGTGAEYRITGGTIDPTDDTWKWIVITRGSSYVRFYINGKLDYSNYSPAVAFNGDARTCLGAWWYMYYSSAEDNFVGYLDDLHILNTELNHATVRQKYAFQMGWI